MVVCVLSPMAVTLTIMNERTVRTHVRTMAATGIYSVDPVAWLLYATCKTKKAKLGVALKQDLFVGISSWCRPKKMDGAWARRSVHHVGRPDNPMAMGHIPRLI
jgi:hypothetical protein